MNCGPEFQFLTGSISKPTVIRLTPLRRCRMFQFLTGSISKPTPDRGGSRSSGFLVSVPHRFDKQADSRENIPRGLDYMFQFLTGSISKPTMFFSWLLPGEQKVSVPHRFDKQADC